MATSFAACLHHPAWAFFLSKVKEDTKFSEIEDFRLTEYNSLSRQIQVRRKLEVSQMKSITAESNIQSEQDALTEMIKS